MLPRTELVLARVLAVWSWQYHFHSTHNKTETQRNQVMYQRSCNEEHQIPNPGVLAYRVYLLCIRQWKTENLRWTLPQRLVLSLLSPLPLFPHS